MNYGNTLSPETTVELETNATGLMTIPDDVEPPEESSLVAASRAVDPWSRHCRNPVTIEGC